MINLASRDIGHHLGRFIFTGIGLGLLIGVTLTMAGVYRGMVADGKAVIAASGADLWVVQKDTLGPWAEPSTIRDDVYRSLASLPGVTEAANVAYLTMQVQVKGKDVRVMLAGIEPGTLGEPAQLIAGRPLLRSHYEAVADEKTGLALGDTVRIRRHDYAVVGLARRATSSSGDPMIYIPLKDAQEVQFLKDNDSLVAERARTAANPALNRPGVPGLLDAVLASQTTSHNVNAVLLRVAPGYPPAEVKAEIGRWKHLTAWTRDDMEERTPVTRMRLRSELLTDEELRERFMRDLDEMQQMLIGALDFLRGKAGDEPASPIDMAALLESLVDDQVELGREVALTAASTPARFEGRPQALRRAIGNLIDNALKYGKRATVALEADDDGLSIVVEDEGPGLPADEIDKVFEPFYRVESSRNRETGGVGLGLAIVRQIASKHGGDVTLVNRPGGGLRAVLRLPQQKP